MTSTPPSAEPASWLLIAIIQDEALLEPVVAALTDLGHGATFINSMGVGQLVRTMRSIPAIFSWSRLMEHKHDLNVTVLSVMRTEAEVDEAAAAITAVVGDLSQPNTGLLFAVPVAHVYGLTRHLPTA